ncbi:hypothetical protein LCGC14_1306970, partial [marine sediment metagenome]
EQIFDYFGKELGKCEECGRNICPCCVGVYKAEVSKFKGTSGTTLPEEALSKTLCLECGVRFEAKLIECGFNLRNRRPRE